MPSDDRVFVSDDSVMLSYAPVIASDIPVIGSAGSECASAAAGERSDGAVFRPDEPANPSGRHIFVTNRSFFLASDAIALQTRVMEKRYLDDLGAFRKRKTFLEDPANKLIWNGNGPVRFSVLTTEVYPLIDSLGDLEADQSVGPSPIAAQQNSAEEDLEGDAIIMSAAISEYYKDNNMIADSQQWDIPDSGWIRVREQRLLDQAKLLRTKLTPLSVGSPAPGEGHGITAARVATYSGFVDKFEEEIGKPGARRGDRKGETMSIPDRCRVIRSKFRSMEKLVKQFGGTPEGDLFVQGFINSGTIDDLPGVHHKTPAQPTPPANP